MGKTKRGKSTKLMAVATRTGAPVAVHIDSASPREVKLIEAAIAARFTAKRSGRLIGDLAYGSDPLDQRPADRGTHLIATHRRNRVRPLRWTSASCGDTTTLEGRASVCLVAHNFRRLVTRYEYQAANFLGLVDLGGMLIFLLMHIQDGLCFEMAEHERAMHLAHSGRSLGSQEPQLERLHKRVGKWRAPAR